jgi:hypothetical protein
MIFDCRCPKHQIDGRLSAVEARHYPTTKEPASSGKFFEGRTALLPIMLARTRSALRAPGTRRRLTMPHGRGPSLGPEACSEARRDPDHLRTARSSQPARHEHHENAPLGTIGLDLLPTTEHHHYSATKELA